VTTVPPPRRSQYCILPKHDPLRAVNILRTAAGLDPPRLAAMYPGTYACTSPERAAIVIADTGTVVSYRQLEDNSARLASALRQLGLRTGDVIAVLSDNAPEAFEIYWAAI
jgi:acyl-CoA synthetase (AMP-forming)/AMP-acid ligase II